MVKALAVLALALPLFATELTVDVHRIQRNDLLTIALSLDDDFASLDDVNIPVRNLAIVGEASVSTEFAWINGRVTRRKTLRYRARPLADGTARVGPLTLNAGGRSLTLPAIDVEVVPDRASGSNDAEVVLRELFATGRDLIFIVAETDRREVHVGEPVTVTWFLYNATTLQEWQIVGVPKLPDFWSEELAKSESTERLYVGNMLMARIAIRRVALFPLRSGRLRVGGTTVQASVLRRGRRGPFAMFEGELAETTFTSAPIDIDAKPLPPGPAVDVVGDVALTCAPPSQSNGGPVVLQVTLAGAGNLRAATPPRFTKPVAGTVQVQGGEVNLPREESSFSETRRWRYLIFPNAPGMLEVPPLSMRAFVPSTGGRRELRCETAFVKAAMARPPAASASEARLPPQAPRRWPWIAVAIAIGVALFVPRFRRELALRREVRAIVRDATPAEIRARVQERVKVDVDVDKGEAWWALLSLLEAAERERDISVGAEKEIERRVADVLRVSQRLPSAAK